MALWLNKVQNLFNNKPLRFILVGGLNTVVGYSIFSLLSYIGLSCSLALFCTTCFGILFNFKTISNMVFNVDNDRLLYKFIILYLALYFLNVGLLKLIDNWFHNIYYSGLLSMLLITIPSYYGNKFLFSDTNVVTSRRIALKEYVKEKKA